MGNINYVWDRFTLCQSIQSKSNKNIETFIESKKEDFKYLVTSETTMGYMINDNQVLTALYGFKINNVDFAFLNYDDKKKSVSRDDIYKMIEDLKKYIKNNKAYYILKVPAHIHWLHRIILELIPENNFCGGVATVYKLPKPYEEKKLNLPDKFITKKNEIEAIKSQIINVSNSTFKDYWGQYDLSYITGEKSWDIYKNWAAEILSKKTTDTIVMSSGGEFLGYATYNNNNQYNEGVLGGVATNAFGKGAYTSIINKMIEDSFSENKIFINGVSSDNYAVLKLHYNLGTNISHITYNFHIDGR